MTVAQTRSQAYAGWDLLSPGRSNPAWRASARLRPGRGLLPHEPLGRRVGDPRLRHLAGEGPRGGPGPQSRRRGGGGATGRPALPVRRDGLGAQERRRGAPCVRVACARAAARPARPRGGPSPGRCNPASSGTECRARRGRRSERLEQLFAQATCFVLPSHSEASAIAYVEAAAAGLPSIGTVAGGSDYLIGDGGLVVDPGDDDALLDAMLWLADPAVAARRGPRPGAAPSASPGRPWAGACFGRWPARRPSRCRDVIGAQPAEPAASAGMSSVRSRPSRLLPQRLSSAAPRSRREHGAERRHVSSARGRPGQRRRRVRGLPERDAERLEAGGPRPEVLARVAHAAARGDRLRVARAPRRRRRRGGPRRAGSKRTRVAGVHEPPAEVGVLAVEEEALVEAADRLEGVAADEHAGAGDPVGRGRRARRRAGSRISSSVHAARGSRRCRKSACANVERSRGKRRWLHASAPSSSRMRGPTSAAAGSRVERRAQRARAAAASIRASGLRKSRNGALRRAARRGCSRSEKPPLRGERTIVHRQVGDRRRARRRARRCRPRSRARRASPPAAPRSRAASPRCGS